MGPRGVGGKKSAEKEIIEQKKAVSLTVVML